MREEKNLISANTPNDVVSFIALGGLEDVTRNLYVYEYKDQILIVDCGLGFPDETMLGVDLLLPDINYLLTSKKKIAGMVLTHGHEDHIGGLPFILPQLPPFPIYASPLTAAMSNEKLIEFGLKPIVQTVPFDESTVQIESFKATFLRVTHSVLDSANIIIQTPAGNFYHGSDFKFDFTPADGHRTEFSKIAKAQEDGVLCLMSDSLGAERLGFSHSEEGLTANFESEMRGTKGKFIIATYSSNVSRLNQAIAAATKFNRKVCFLGRSIIKVKTIAQRLGYMNIPKGMEVPMDQLSRYKDNQLMILAAGSQGQENSALTRIADGVHKEVKAGYNDVVVLSSDIIPGNEVAVNSLIDSLSKKGVRVLYSNKTPDFHVSGHGSSEDLKLLIALVKAKYLLPISGTYRQMVAYREIAQKMGYKKQDIFIVENGQEVIYSKSGARLGRKVEIKNVYVDQVSGEEVENYLIRDREKLGREGVVIVLAEINAATGQLAHSPEVVMRGSSLKDVRENLSTELGGRIAKELTTRSGKITNWVNLRRLIGDMAERYILKEYRSRPLVLPVIIEA
jgi:ribonuclease J